MPAAAWDAAVAEAGMAAVEAVAEALLPFIAHIGAEAGGDTCRRASLTRNVSLAMWMKVVRP